MRRSARGAARAALRCACSVGTHSLLLRTVAPAAPVGALGAPTIARRDALWAAVPSQPRSCSRAVMLGPARVRRRPQPARMVSRVSSQENPAHKLTPAPSRTARNDMVRSSPPAVQRSAISWSVVNAWLELREAAHPLRSTGTHCGAALAGIDRPRPSSVPTARTGARRAASAGGPSSAPSCKLAEAYCIFAPVP